MKRQIPTPEDLRNITISFKLNPREVDQLNQKVHDYGFDRSAYLRDVSLGFSTERKRRPPVLNERLLGVVASQLSRYHGSLYQIQKRLNFGESILLNDVLKAIEETKAVLANLMDLIQEARGRR